MTSFVRRCHVPRAMLVGLVLAVELATTAAARADTAFLGVDLGAALHAGRVASGAPEATATLIRCGRLLWSGADGTPAIGSGRRARPSDRFVVASSTKPVTAALILLLAEHGRLSLNTPLARFYPALPDARLITVRMLLDHTSGLNEYFDDPHVSQMIAVDPRHHWTRSEVLHGITRTLFTPGTRESYSNSAYVVLGGIVEKVSGLSVEQAFRRWIGDPLGLTDSTFAYHPTQSRLFAHPYLLDNGGLHDAYVPGYGIPADYWGPVWTDGGLASDSPDLARFGDALFHGKIVAARILAEMTHPTRFGTRLGIDHQRYDGRTWLGHNGRYGGYESELWFDRTRGVTVVVNTNAEHSSLEVWQAIVRSYDRRAARVRECG